MNDFSPEARNAAWWSGDSRRAVTGELVDVILEKQGKKAPPEFSDPEPLEMGKRMQAVVGAIFSETTGIQVRTMDEAVTHKSEKWLKSHTDFMTNDGGLLEVKNYNAQVITKFSEPDEPLRIPAADYVQCVHEATVFNVPHVWFAVLFGGQRFRHYKIEVSDTQKDEHVKQCAEWWAHIHSGTLPDPETPAQARAVFPINTQESIIASEAVERAAHELKALKGQIKMLEDHEANLTVALQQYMRDHASIVSVDGSVLVTWKASKSSKKFNEAAFKAAMPDTWAQFCTETPGSRRFLVK